MTKRVVLFSISAAAGAIALACTAPYGENVTEPSETLPMRDDAGVDGDTPINPVKVDGAVDEDATIPETDAGVDAETPIIPKCDRSKPFGGATRVAGGVSTNNDDESDARVSVDERTIVFSSDRGTNPKRNRFWTATRASASADFGAASLLLEDPTEPVYDATFGPTGLTVVFQAGGFSTPARLRFAMRANVGGPFTAAIDLPGANGAQTDERDPSLTTDGKRLVFTRNAPGGTSDIFFATTLDQKSITNVAPIAELNGGSNERDPVLTQEGLEIFFASDRLAGAGKMRIFHATRKSTSAPFGTPTPLTELAGTLQYEAPTWTSPDGCVLYFSSDRSSTSIDVYRAVRPK